MSEQNDETNNNRVPEELTDRFSADMARVASVFLDVADEVKKRNWVRAHCMMQIVLRDAIQPAVNTSAMLMIAEGSGEPFDAENPFPGLDAARKAEAEGEA